MAKKKNSAASRAVSSGSVKDKRSHAVSSVEQSRQADQEFFDRHEQEDERNTEYASQREETRARRKHRQRESRASRKDSFIQTDGSFHNKKSFIEEAGAETARSDKLKILEKKAEKAARKTQKEKRKLKQQKEYRLVKHVDEKTGKTVFELQTNRIVKTGKKRDPVKDAGYRAMSEAQGFVHDKIAENEKDNSAVEAAHKSEEAVERVVTGVKDIKQRRNARKIRKVAALDKKQFAAETKLRYREYLEKHPEMQKNPLQKQIQKHRIKREYAKALKKGTDAKQAAGYAQKAANKTTNLARRIAEYAAKHKGVIAVAALFGLFFMLITASVSSCAAMLGGGVSTTMAGSYQSAPAQIDACDVAMSRREAELQNSIDSIESSYPGYDEYNYNIDAIGHDPFVLINYLSAVHIDVVAADVRSEIDSLFHEMYTLTLTPREETRTRTVTKTRTVINETTGEAETEEYEDEEEYTVTILDVVLTRKPLEDVVAERLEGNSDAAMLYEVYQDTHGALQQFYSPLDMDWYGKISSYYGYRKSPISGEYQFHRGIDIAVPEGTPVYATQDGTVTTAAYDDGYGNYIVIKDAKGRVSKYAHLQTIEVSAGQSVVHGTVIGKTGNTGSGTGPHLHLECMAGGEYYNPLFYFESGKFSAD